MSSFFSPPKPRPVLPPPPPPPPPPPEEADTEIDKETGDVKKRKKAGRNALIRTSARGVLNDANTGRSRLTAS